MVWGFVYFKGIMGGENTRIVPTGPATIQKNYCGHKYAKRII